MAKKIIKNTKTERKKMRKSPRYKEIKTEKIRKSEDKSRIPCLRIVVVPERAERENKESRNNTRQFPEPKDVVSSVKEPTNLLSYIRFKN